MGNERVSTDLAGDHGDHQDDSGVKRSTQRRPTPLCTRERSGQRGKQRHIPDRIDRRPDGSKIFANLDQERRHLSEMCVLALYERESSARQSWPNSYFLN